MMYKTIIFLVWWNHAEQLVKFEHWFVKLFMQIRGKISHNVLMLFYYPRGRRGSDKKFVLNIPKALRLYVSYIGLHIENKYTTSMIDIHMYMY